MWLAFAAGALAVIVVGTVIELITDDAVIEDDCLWQKDPIAPDIDLI